MSTCAATVEETEDQLSRKILTLDIDRKVVKDRELPGNALKDDKIQSSNKSGTESYIEVKHYPKNIQNSSDTEHESIELWEDYEPYSGHVTYASQKHSQRMKLKDHNIISNNKTISRLPTDYKFDRRTTQILEMLIDQQLSGEFHNAVAKGTKSIVIHAHCYGIYHMYFPCGNAIKIYKLKNDINSNNAIYKQVQRENDHLKCLQEQHFSNNTPHPVYTNKNIIMMSFIGSEQETAPSISVLPPELLNASYDEIVKELNIWYNKLGLIHGNLRASHILYWTGKLYFIGWSNSVRKDHQGALKKLMKDCHFVTAFFQSRGVKVKNAEELFKTITGLEKISSKVLEVVHKDLWKDPRRTNPNRTATSSRSTRDRFK